MTINNKQNTVYFANTNKQKQCELDILFKHLFLNLQSGDVITELKVYGNIEVSCCKQPLVCAH
jgi:hypothetical protein